MLAQQVVMAELGLHPGPGRAWWSDAWDGYAADRDRWYADLRVVDTIERPGAPVRTLASYVVESGRPGAEQV